MTYLRHCVLSLIAVIVLHLAMPCQAKDGNGGDDDCDGITAGTISIDGALTVASTSQLSSCATKLELTGTLVVQFSSADGKHIGQPKIGEATLRVISVDVTDDNGLVSTSHSISGALDLLECTADGRCKTGTSLDVHGVGDSDGALLLIMEDMKRVRSQSTLSSARGRITFKGKEGASLTARGSYVGHVTVVK